MCWRHSGWISGNRWMNGSIMQFNWWLEHLSSSYCNLYQLLSKIYFITRRETIVFPIEMIISIIDEKSSSVFPEIQTLQSGSASLILPNSIFLSMIELILLYFFQIPSSFTSLIPELSNWTIMKWRQIWWCWTLENK